MQENKLRVGSRSPRLILLWLQVCGVTGQAPPTHPRPFIEGLGGWLPRILGFWGAAVQFSGRGGRLAQEVNQAAPWGSVVKAGCAWCGLGLLLLMLAPRLLTLRICMREQMLF